MGVVRGVCGDNQPNKHLKKANSLRPFFPHLAPELDLGELEDEGHALVADLEHDVGVARPRDVDVEAHLI